MFFRFLLAQACIHVQKNSEPFICDKNFRHEYLQRRSHSSLGSACQQILVFALFVFLLSFEWYKNANTLTVLLTGFLSHSARKQRRFHSTLHKNVNSFCIKICPSTFGTSLKYSVSFMKNVMTVAIKDKTIKKKNLVNTINRNNSFKCARNIFWNLRTQVIKGSWSKVKVRKIYCFLFCFVLP